MKVKLLHAALWLAAFMGPHSGQGGTLSIQPVSPIATVSETAVHLEWPSRQGVLYQIEESSSPSTESWIPLSNRDGSPLTQRGTGRRLRIDLPLIEQGSRFFRIRPLTQSSLRRLSSSGASPAFTSSDPIAYWPFDSIDACETPELIQSIPASLNTHCEQEGPFQTEGVLDQALVFDGVDDRAIAAHSPELTQLDTFTSTAWIRVAPSTGWRPLIDHRDAGSDGWDLYLDPSSRLFIRVNSETSAGSSVIPFDEWTFVAASFDGTHARLYLNGALDSVESFSTTPLSIQSVLKIGEHFSLTSLHFSGALDELGIYDYALSDAEIQSAYEQSNPHPPSYSLTVSGGTGSGDYLAGEQIAIEAAAPPTRESFDQWIGDTDAILAPTQANTSLVMPDRPFTIAASYRERASNLADALQAHWTFNENQDCSTVDEISGQLNSLGPDCANDNVPQWTFGLEASALLFDVRDDQILIRDRPDLSHWQALTLSAWVKPSPTSEGWRPIGDLRDADANGFDLYLEPVPNKRSC